MLLPSAPVAVAPRAERVESAAEAWEFRLAMREVGLPWARAGVVEAARRRRRVVSCMVAGFGFDVVRWRDVCVCELNQMVGAAERNRGQVMKRRRGLAVVIYDFRPPLDERCRDMTATENNQTHWSRRINLGRRSVNLGRRSEARATGHITNPLICSVIGSAPMFQGN
ncbi:hypothetical protein BDY17DRAFT_43769 [Neohortaea acidophila]|uniref:Uncharacterized protein n=1 Tax=Neohortaea acidophila TaxID=245834 RepID=A0A6A6PJ07_9PEZI|nr:uncharacterized protein BDY17DRAFT_43769 [Neohortaea acidophila]KAF2479694.1 hypothetical protein BDY17DRAFT_43769 [Neohortaea acidophila]